MARLEGGRASEWEERVADKGNGNLGQLKEHVHVFFETHNELLLNLGQSQVFAGWGRVLQS